MPAEAMSNGVPSSGTTRSPNGCSRAGVALEDLLVQELDTSPTFLMLICQSGLSVPPVSEY